MYYLKTRYYNPNWCRFISSDNINYLEYDNPLNISLFRYCANNPIMNVDPDGTISGLVIVAIIAACAVLINHAITGIEILVAKCNSNDVYTKDADLNSDFSRNEAL